VFLFYNIGEMRGWLGLFMMSRKICLGYPKNHFSSNRDPCSLIKNFQWYVQLDLYAHKHYFNEDTHAEWKLFSVSLCIHDGSPGLLLKYAHAISNKLKQSDGYVIYLWIQRGFAVCQYVNIELEKFLSKFLRLFGLQVKVSWNPLSKTS